jgi:hypothetical protein
MMHYLRVYIRAHVLASYYEQNALSKPRPILSFTKQHSSFHVLDSLIFSLLLTLLIIKARRFEFGRRQSNLFKDTIHAFAWRDWSKVSWEIRSWHLPIATLDKTNMICFAFSPNYKHTYKLLYVGVNCGLCNWLPWPVHLQVPILDNCSFWQIQTTLIIVLNSGTEWLKCWIEKRLNFILLLFIVSNCYRKLLMTIRKWTGDEIRPHFRMTSHKVR